MMTRRQVRALLTAVLTGFVVLAGCAGGNDNHSVNTPPIAPEYNGIPVSGNGKLTLFWKEMTGVTSFNVYIASDPMINAHNYGTLPEGMKFSNITGTNYKITGLVNDRTYYFVVTAQNSYGESGESDVGSAAPTYLPAPTGVLASAGNGQVVVSWNIVPGATQYSVILASQAGLTSDNCLSLPDCMGYVANGGSTDQYTVAPLTNGKTYYFIVTAVTFTTLTRVIASDDSSEVSATPQ
jgi:hypothetical protein